MGVRFLASLFLAKHQNTAVILSVSSMHPMHYEWAASVLPVGLLTFSFRCLPFCDLMIAFLPAYDWRMP